MHSLTRTLLSLLFVVLISGQLAAQKNDKQSSDQPFTGEQIDGDSLFSSERVIEIEIDLSPEDWDEIRLQSRNFISAIGKEPAVSPFSYVKANIKIDGVEIRNVGIRKKGFIGSLNNDRPSLKVRFDKYVDQKPVAGLTRLTLNNNNQDPGRVLQYINYKLFNDSGTYSPRCGFAKVTVNGNYLGIYSNVESIKQPFLERGFKDGTGALYEGTTTDFFPEWTKRFEKKNDAASRKHLKKLASLFAEPQIDLKKLERRLDIDAFIKFWAMESVLGFWDGYCSNQNNYFVYRNPENKKLYFIPWGTDASLTKIIPFPPYRMKPASVHAKAIIPNRLYRIPEIQARYLAALEKILAENWNEEVLLAELDRVKAMLEPHVLEDNERFASSISGYQKFIKTRRKDLLRELKKGPPELPEREKMPIYFVPAGELAVTFSTKWYDKTPKETAGLGDVSVAMKIDGKEVKLTDVGAYCETSKFPSPTGEQPASIVIVGVRESDGKHLTFGTGLATDLFKDGIGKPQELGGIMLVDRNFMDPKKIKMLGGSVTLEESSMVDGQTVKGSMNLTIIQMQGGDPVVDKNDAQPEKQ